MAVVTMRQLLESGVHFGHQTRRWNPKMKRFIFTERNGIYIVDLQQSLGYIDTAYNFVKETVAHGGTILFVGTKKQAQEPVAEQAARVGMPYVNQRWLGGMLTNFTTVNKRLQRLKELEQVDFDDVAGSSFTKKELLIMRREKDKLAKTLGGIRDMGRVPSAVWIVDTNKEHLAVDEARKLNIPIVAILDTNCDPDVVDYKIPGNDDAIRAVTLLTRVIADAVAEGLMQRHSGRAAGADAAAEPLAEWERELLAGSEAELASPSAAAAPVDTTPGTDAAESDVNALQTPAPEVTADLTETQPGQAGPAEVATAPGQDAAPAVEAAAQAAAPDIAAAEQADSAQAEAQPADAAPTIAESADAQPADAAPTVAELADVQPAVVEQAVAEAADTEPADAAPAVADADADADADKA